MSSSLNHAFIPVVILMLFATKLNIKPKYILFLSIFAVLPDIDMLIVHRATFHNIFTLLIPLLGYVIINRQIFGIISFFILSHLILDIYSGGIHLFYPISNKVLYAWTEIRYGEPNVFNYGFSTDTLEIIKHGESIISSENVAVMLLLLMIISLIILKPDNRNKMNSGE